MTDFVMVSAASSSSTATDSSYSQFIEEARALTAGTTAKYAILFDEGDDGGYLLVRRLEEGANAQVALVRSVKTGKLYVRKHVDHATNPSHVFIPREELNFYRNLSHHSWALTLHSSVTNHKKQVVAATTEFCNGGNVRDFFDHHATDQNREILVWHILHEMLKIVTHLQTGCAIIHGDVHMGNIYLHFDENQVLPKVILGDFGMARYKSKWRARDNILVNTELDFFLADLRTVVFYSDIAVSKHLTDLLTDLYERKRRYSVATFLKEVGPQVAQYLSQVDLSKIDMVRPTQSNHPMLFDSTTPKVSSAKHGLIARLGRPFKWVKMDLCDTTLNTFEMVQEEKAAKRQGGAR